MATTNPGKLLEYEALLSGIGVRIAALADLVKDFPIEGGHLPEPEEGAASFAENARLKARHYAAISGMPVLADDSGLLVKALNGRPGVLSARYGGPGLSDLDRCRALLTEMLGRVDRRAEFRASLALAFEDRIESWEAGLKGRITLAPKGEAGFGYDPVFIPDGFDATLAEMSPAEKNAISHRSKVMALAKADLPGILGGTLKCL